MSDKVRKKVADLFAKAESSEFEEEANTYREAAELLMVKYSIEQHTLMSSSGEIKKPVKKVGQEEAPYVLQKMMLLSAIADVFNCFVVRVRFRSEKVSFYHLHGFQEDVDAVLFLHESLKKQMMQALLTQEESSAAFRRSFMIGFAQEVEQRLREMFSTQTQDAEPGTDIVLVDARAKVQEAVDKEYGKLSTSKHTYSGSGELKGKAAGAAADITTDGRKISR